MVMDGFILVSEKTLDDVSKATNLPRSYWERELERFEGFARHLIVFPNERGQIVSTSFSKEYDVPFVMKQKFGLEAQ